jgi:hypothetical protein
MIKEFYLAMEDKEEAKKYEPLRHTLSHYGQIRPSTIKNWKRILKKSILNYPIVYLTTALLRILSIYRYKQKN